MCSTRCTDGSQSGGSAAPLTHTDQCSGEENQDELVMGIQGYEPSSRTRHGEPPQ